MANFLSPVVSNSLPTGTGPTLVIITDSLLQSGLTLFREFITTSLERNESNIVIALEQSPSKLFNSKNVDLIDCSAPPPFATSSTSTTQFVDIDGENGITSLITAILSVIELKKKEGKKIMISIDSMNVLAEFGVHEVTRVMRKVLKALESCQIGSRLVVLHHDGFPTLSTPSNIAPSLLTTLLSPAISSSTIHLILHPAALIELLSREYGLMIPLSEFSDQIDLRLTSFLTSFSNRVYGNPFIRPTSSAMEDERLQLDIGGEQGAGYAVQWTARGVSMPVGGGKKRETAVGTAKKIITRGLEGVRRRDDRVHAVPLREVVDFDKMSQLSIPKPVLSSMQPAKVVEPALPFNLSLTDSQRSAREEVVLPYLPKEDGSVEYIPDEGDDFDDDDPDEDLEI